ncbi:hypothetical protein [Flavobacterium sp. 3HN19-14]|uniref:hypothetical protein n=1 Tax=Flavobacterium sp. 3HN19-14 TaxID=3448133 RepID=UPI003EE0D0C9
MNRFNGTAAELTDYSTNVDDYRHDNNDATDNPALLPKHNFKTQYRYNSLNQLVWQYTPDGGETRFAYDPLGRIVASQNAKQKASTFLTSPALEYDNKLTGNANQVINNYVGTNT